MKDIIIIGAGTAGLSAAIYGARAGKSVLIIEKYSYGGQIINATEVENYPGIKNISGFEFATNLYEQAIDLGAEIVLEKAKGIEDLGTFKKVITDSGEYESKAVIIATGSKNRPLGLEKEEELIGKGISYCATCDGAFFRNKDVAVVGGGNTAIEDALFLSEYCNKVYVIHRRDSFRAEEKEVEKLKSKSNVIMHMNSRVVSLEGESQLSGVTIENINDSTKDNISVSGLFIAIGQMPDNEEFRNVVSLDEKGYVIAGEDCLTNTEGIFVAGDCRTKEVRQLATAAADGAVSGLKAGSI